MKVGCFLKANVCSSKSVQLKENEENRAPTTGVGNLLTSFMTELHFNRWRFAFHFDFT